MKFKPGYIGGWTTEERLFMLKLVKLAKPENELEKRIMKRMITRFMGYPIFHLPLHPKKECPICEYEFAGKSFDRHVAACTEKQREKTRRYKIDPVVYEMLGLN